MVSSWQSEMEEIGIYSAAGMPMEPLAGDALPDVPLWVDLSHLTVIHVNGSEARDFLQGQFCNDLGLVENDQAQLSGYCTPKGRLLAIPIVLTTESGFLLAVPDSVSEAFVKRLSMFVLRADVSIAIKNDLVCTGLISDSAGNWGRGLASDLVLADKPLSAANDSTVHIINWQPIELEGVLRQRRLLIATESQQLNDWQAHREIPKTSASLWRLGDIQQGVPSVVAATSDAFVPQMVNLQLIDALSFTKGCYPGQEIVARMQYLGKIKRHMQRFVMPLPDAADASLVPKQGDALVNGDDDNAGIVVDAVGVDDVVELLAVVKVSAVEDTFTFQGGQLSAVALPYELPSLVDSEGDCDSDRNQG